jgi:hypothetical protein
MNKTKTMMRDEEQPTESNCCYQMMYVKRVKVYWCGS